MRAAVLQHAGIDGLTIRDDVEPIKVTDTLVRVRVRAAGVCHSDLSAVNGRLGLPTPVVIGHEAAGEVVETGPEVTGFAPGDRVIISWVPQCGRCPRCRGGQPALCTCNMDPGYLRPRFSVAGQAVKAQAGCGVFAEEVVVTQDNLVPLPDDVPFEIGALVSCGVTTGVGSVFNTAALRPGDSCVVIGCGGVGMAIIQAARAAGAETVIAVDPVASKRQLAVELGASTAVAPENLTDLCSDGGFDVAFEAVGAPATIRAAYDATRRGGKTVIVGVGPRDATVDFSPYELYATGRQLIGSVFGSSDIRRDFLRSIDLWRSRQLRLDSLISDRIDLAAVPDALRALSGGSVLRSVVHLPGKQ